MVFWPRENGWFNPKHCISQGWQHMPVISMLRVEARGEKFEVILSYIPNLSQKKNKASRFNLSGVSGEVLSGGLQK